MPVDEQTSIPLTTALLQQGIEDGLHLGAQLYVSRHSEAVADLAIGEARIGVPMTTDTLNLWFSATKAVTAVAVAQVWGRGGFALDDLVMKYIPEFGQGGKEAITIRHILTHTGGFRFYKHVEFETDWTTTIAAVCAASLERGWLPGRKAGYHQGSSWYILGEMVRRLDGRPFDQYVREEIFLPLGMTDCWIGMPPAQYQAYGERIGYLYRTEEGGAERGEFWNSERECASVRPGGNGHGPMRQFVRLYEALLGGGELGGKHILKPVTVAAITARHRTGMYDVSFKHVLDYGLGLILDSKMYGLETVPYNYGRHCSPRTFGHSGYQSSAAFADPEFGLAVALYCNGLPGDEWHNRRFRDLLSAIYDDLGIRWEQHQPSS